MANFDSEKYQLSVCEGVFAYLRHKGMLKPKRKGFSSSFIRSATSALKIFLLLAATAKLSKLALGGVQSVPQVLTSLPMFKAE